MAFLNLNGWAIPVATCELAHAHINAASGYTPNGLFTLQRNSFARTWRVRTGLLTSAERDALLEMLGHRGDGWRWGLLGETAKGWHTLSKHFYSDKRRAAQTAEEVATVVSAYAADGTRVYDWNYNPVAPQAGTEGAVCVDKGSTNLLSANEAHPTTNGHLLNFGAGTHAADSVRYWTGSGAVTVTAPAAGDGVQADATVSIGVDYVCSVHVYPYADSQPITVRYTNGAGTTISQVVYTLPTAGYWYRLKTFGTQTVDTTARIRVLSNSGAAASYAVDGLQIEAQSTGHPTSWIDPGADVWGSGNGVRPAGVLDFDPFYLDWRNGFTVSTWVNAQTLGSATSDIIWDSSDGFPRFVVYKTSADAFRADVQSSDGQTLSAVGSATTAGIHHVAAVFDPDASSLSLYVDGALAQTDTSWAGSGSREKFDVEKTTGDMSVGSGGVAGANNWLGTIGALQVLPYTVPASVVAGWYDSGTDDRAQPGVMPLGCYGTFLQQGDSYVDVYAQVDAAPHEPYFDGATWQERGGRVAFTLFEAEKR